MSGNGKNAPDNSGEIDPDDAPELDDAFFERAEFRHGGVLIKAGKPPVGEPSTKAPKQPVEKKD